MALLNLDILNQRKPGTSSDTVRAFRDWKLCPPPAAEPHRLHAEVFQYS